MHLMILRKDLFYGMKTFTIFHKIASAVFPKISTWWRYMLVSPLHLVGLLQMGAMGGGQINCFP